MTYEECARKILDGTANHNELLRWWHWRDRAHGSDVMEAAYRLMLSGMHSTEFYQYRCRQFQEWAHTLPEPYATQAFNILANGKAQP